MSEHDAKVGSRLSFFVESDKGLKGYLEVSLDDIQPHQNESRADALVRTFAAVGARLASLGFKHDSSFDKPAFGGGGRPGNKRPEDPAPADIAVPEHCGEKMIYKPEWTNKEQKVITARYVCRKDKQCEDVTSGKSQWPHTVFEDAYRRSLPKVDDGIAPANGTQRPTSATVTPDALSDFWKQCRALGFTPEKVTQLAGAAPATLNADGLAALLTKLRVEASA